jgi:hypothetical protein
MREGGRFMSLASPSFKIPSQLMVSRDCYEFYLDERLRMKRFLSTKSSKSTYVSPWKHEDLQEKKN